MNIVIFKLVTIYNIIILVTWNTAFFNNFVMNNTTSVAVRIFMSKQSKQQGF